MSRCTVVKFNKLSPDEIFLILKRAIQKIRDVNYIVREEPNEGNKYDDSNNQSNINSNNNSMIMNMINIVTDNALRYLAIMSDGDGNFLFRNIRAKKKELNFFVHFF